MLLLGLLLAAAGCGDQRAGEAEGASCLDAIGDVGDEYQATTEVLSGDCDEREIAALEPLGIDWFWSGTGPPVETLVRNPVRCGRLG